MINYLIQNSILGDNMHEIPKPELGAKQHFTVEKLKKFMPKGSGRGITEVTVKMLNKMSEGMDVGLFEEQLLSHSTLMGPGIGYKQLAQAIKYVILVNVLELTSEKAWMIVFPEKSAEMIREGRDMSSFAAQFSNNKTVIEIQKKTILSAKASLAPEFFRSIKKLVELRDGLGANERDKVSPTVQLNAAIALTEKLAPETDNVIKLGMDEDSKNTTAAIISELKRIGTVQKEDFTRGKSISEVQRLGLGEAIDVEIE
jgi:hypothetical protein